MADSKVPQPLRDNLVKLGATLAIGAVGAGGAYIQTQPTYELGGVKVSHEVAIAHEMGRYFESSYRHIGTPYVDKVGKGQPLTVCNGVTGPEVVAGKTYGPADCARLELPKYLSAEKAAKRLFTHWPEYNAWQRASFIDMIYNLGESALVAKTITRKANAGDLAGACNEMPRWVYGTVKGVSTKLPGLVPRRGTTQELCAEWGRSGHFSAASFDLIPVAQPMVRIETAGAASAAVQAGTVPEQTVLVAEPEALAVSVVGVSHAANRVDVLDTISEQSNTALLLSLLVAAVLAVAVLWRTK
jgi:lysozyme